jgi:outer membrane receptor for monomeric catechols
MGVDQFNFQNQRGTFKADIPWGNKTGTLRWNHQFSPKIFANTTAVYNDYKFASNFTQNTFGIQLASGIRDYNLKTDFDYYPGKRHHFKAGVGYTYHKFIPNQISGQIDTIKLDPNNAFVKYGHEGAAYLLDDFDATKWWKINIGIRYSGFAQVGPYTLYTYDPAGKAIDSAMYGNGDLVKAYGGWEPRFNMRFELTDNSSLKTSIAKSYQYIHLISNNGSTLPTDVWVPSTYRVKPQMAWQYSAGYFRNFLDDRLETSVEVYYKDMKNQIQYKDGYTPNTLEDPELSYVFGNGQAYGAEFFINKTQGNFTGWIGYTLSWTNQKFPDLNGGKTFPAKYDRRHDISIVSSYRFSDKWSTSAVFVYGSGNAITLPTAYYIVDNRLVQSFSALNAYRLPAYHRLDVSATYTPRHSKAHKFKWEDSWTFSVYNLYNRHNPYFLYVDNQGSVSNGISVKVYMVYILPIMPSITYNFKF